MSLHNNGGTSLVDQTLYQLQQCMYYITSTQTEGSGDYMCVGLFAAFPGMWTVRSTECVLLMEVN